MPSSRYVRHVCLDDAVTTGVGTPHALAETSIGMGCRCRGLGSASVHLIAEAWVEWGLEIAEAGLQKSSKARGGRSCRTDF